MKTLIFTCLMLLSIVHNSQAQSYKIGILMDDFISSRWAKDSTVIADEIRRLGHQPLIRYSDSDSKLQYKQACSLIRSGVNSLIVIASDYHEAAIIVKKANRCKVPVLAYDRLIAGPDLKYYISFDAIMVGELQAQYLVDSLHGKGTIMIVNGPESDANANLFKQGQYKVLQPYIDSNQIKVVFQKSISEWTSMEAMMECSNFLPSYSSKIDAVLAANDDIADGAMDAFATFRPNEKILITGQDGNDKNIQLIKDGVQTMTVYKPIEKMAQEAAQIAIKLAAGQQVSLSSNRIYNGTKDVEFIKMSPIVIDSKNIAQLNK